MANPAINFLALSFYLAAAVLIGVRLIRGTVPTAGARLGTLGLVFGALILHGASLHAVLDVGNQINLALPAAFSAVAWIVVALYLLTALSRPVDSIGLLVMPFAALTVFGTWQWLSQQPVMLSSPAQAAHILVALLAYSLLCLAAAQSVLLLLQERGLKRRHPGGFLHALPPMETTETLMFQMIGLGFALLTLTVLSGVVFSESLLGKPFQIKHHTVLALGAWIVYALLLFGRWRLGWRGRVAVRWALGGFLLLILAYFGSKFVLEVLLQRG